MEQKLYQEIKKHFFINPDNITKIANFGGGLINDTYILTGEQKYILQRINKGAFKNVEKLMDNITAVLNFIKVSNKDACLPEIIYTLDKKPYYCASDGEFYRIYTFVENTISYIYAKDDKIFAQSAEAFAEFQLLLKDFPSEQLYDTIPDFHNTKKRLQTFINAYEINSKNRKKYCMELISELIKRKEYASVICDKLDSGEIPLRVTHNDSKISNVLFNKKGGYACIVDYDTIMSGSLLYDFGDAIRDGCNTTKEDEKNLDIVEFDYKRYKIYTKAFYEKLKAIITPAEKQLLAFAPLILTYELCLRFLSDYLKGDIYFKIKYASHNLIRAECQFRLLNKMEEKLSDMENFVNSL